MQVVGAVMSMASSGVSAVNWLPEMSRIRPVGVRMHISEIRHAEISTMVLTSCIRRMHEGTWRPRSTLRIICRPI